MEQTGYDQQKPLTADATEQRSGAERRVCDRWVLEGAVRVIFDGQYDFDCQINDVSASGVSVQTTLAPPLGALAVVYIPGVGRLKAEAVRVVPLRDALGKPVAEGDSAGHEVALQFLLDDGRKQAILKRLERQVLAEIEKQVQGAIASL